MLLSVSDTAVLTFDCVDGVWVGVMADFSVRHIVSLPILPLVECEICLLEDPFDFQDYLTSTQFFF